MKPDPSRLKEIEAVFDRIVELPRAAWPAALKQACGDDAELRAEVESLLVRRYGNHQNLERKRRALRPPV